MKQSTKHTIPKKGKQYHGGMKNARMQLKNIKKGLNKFKKPDCLLIISKKSKQQRIPKNVKLNSDNNT